MEDSQILDLLRRKSPQTTLEVAKAAKMSWHVIQEQLLELQIDGKLDRITVGRQNLWFLKGQKWKGSTGLSSIFMLVGLVAVIAIIGILLATTHLPSNASNYSTTIINQTPLNYVIYDDSNDPRYRTTTEEQAVEQDNWISYNNVTNTITLKTVGTACTQMNPCTFADIYKASSENNWSAIDNAVNYFTTKSTIVIDGYLVSMLEQVYITKPLIIGKNGAARFGIFDGYPHSGIFLETNVSAADEINGSALINYGAIEFYDSYYKVYSTADNSIYQSPDAIFRINRFDIQRTEPGNTIFYLPARYILDDYVRRGNILVKNSTEVSS